MKKNLLFILSFIFLASLFYSCYNDKKEQLYPAIYLIPCDTTNFNYSSSVKNILDNYCNSCHSTANAGAAGGVVLDNYSDVKVYVANGKLVASMKHDNGTKPMPPGTQVDDCRITTIVKWVEAGALNN